MPQHKYRMPDASWQKVELLQDRWAEFSNRSLFQAFHIPRPRAYYFHVLIKGEMSILNVVSSQTGCARLCMPSAPLSLCSWSVNGLSLLPPLFSPLPTLSLTKRRDLHNMHAVEAYIVQKKKPIYSTAGHERDAVLIFLNRGRSSLSPELWSQWLWTAGSPGIVQFLCGLMVRQLVSQAALFHFEVAIQLPAWCPEHHWTAEVNKRWNWWFRTENKLQNTHRHVSLALQTLIIIMM